MVGIKEISCTVTDKNVLQTDGWADKQIDGQALFHWNTFGKVGGPKIYKIEKIQKARKINIVIETQFT